VRYFLTALILFVSFQAATADEVSRQYKGLKITANLVKVGDNWRQGPVLLMTHGTLAHSRMEIMATLQQLFAERGYSSLAVNLSLGVSDRKGMYDCKVPHTHRHSDALDEIGLWRDWLKAQGVDNIVLLGHSRGGNQTAWFAAERDDPSVRAVVLVAPALWSEDYAARNYQKRYGKPLAPVLARAESLVKQDKGDTLMQPVDFIYCKDAAATARAFVSYYRADPRRHTPHLLRSIDKPVLVFAGSADTVVAGLEEQMAGVLGRDNISLQTLEGADHFFRDLYAEDLADSAVDFIEAHQ
jgi:pimeloyl-ACP methyl ester carboxylesterase